MRTDLPLFATLVLLLGAAAPARAEFVPVSSELRLEADADAGGFTATDGPRSDMQSGTTNPLTVSVDALAVDADAGASVDATANGSATWTSPSEGQVILSNIGWTTVSPGIPWSASLNNGLDYSYTFTATEAGTLMFTYDVTVFDNSSGLNGFNYSFDGDMQTFGSGSSGTLMEAIAAGTTYTLNLKNLATTSGTVGRSDHMTGTFDFSFTPSVASPAPEPSSLTLLGAAGAALAGWHWRRKRKA